MESETIHMLGKLTQAIRDLGHEIRGLRDHRELVKLIEQQGIRIMSAISEFATRQSAFNDRIDSAVAGLASDVEQLTALIKKLQDSAGQITPEDQALLDQIEARSDTIATKLEALDALTPPTPPVV